MREEAGDLRAGRVPNLHPRGVSLQHSEVPAEMELLQPHDVHRSPQPSQGPGRRGQDEKRVRLLHTLHGPQQGGRKWRGERGGVMITCIPDVPSMLRQSSEQPGS